MAQLGESLGQLKPVEGEFVLLLELVQHRRLGRTTNTHPAIFSHSKGEIAMEQIQRLDAPK